MSRWLNGEHGQWLIGGECLMPGFTGVGQHDHGWGALEPVQGDPPDRAVRGEQHAVAEVHLGRGNGAGGRHRCLPQNGCRALRCMVSPTPDNALM